MGPTRGLHTWKCLWRRRHSGYSLLCAARRRPAMRRRPWRPSHRQRLCRTMGCRRRPRRGGPPIPSRPWPRSPRRTARGRTSRGRPARRVHASRSTGSPALGEAEAPAGSLQAGAAAVLSHGHLCICKVSSYSWLTPEAPIVYLIITGGCRMQPCLHTLTLCTQTRHCWQAGGQRQQVPVVLQKQLIMLQVAC